MENKAEVQEESKLKVLGDDYSRLLAAKQNFGWSLTKGETKRPFPIKYYTLFFQRSKDIPYHDRMVELEKLYFDAEAKREYYYKGDVLNYAFLYLLFIVPGVIYTLLKIHSKKRISENNAEVGKTQAICLSEARSILDSFFGGQGGSTKRVPYSSVNKPVSLRQSKEDSEAVAPGLPSDNNKTSPNLTQKTDDQRTDNFR